MGSIQMRGLAWLVCLAACQTTDPEPASVDAMVPSRADSGAPFGDTGSSVDAAVFADALPRDSGVVVDAGVVDAGEPPVLDAGFDPCTPNPCPATRASECDGDVQLEYPTPATCVAVGGQPECQWTPQRTSCVSTGLTCAAGECVRPELHHRGHARVRNSTEAASLAMYSSIDGNLVITADAPEQVSLPLLSSVTGAVLVQATNRLRTVDLPALQTIGSMLTIRDNDALERANLGAVERVGANLAIYDNPQLTEVELAALTAAPSVFNVLGNASLTRLEAPRLGEIGGDLSIRDAPRLTAISFGALDRIGGDVRLEHLAALTSVSFGPLQTIDGRLLLRGAPELSALAAPSLTTIAGDLDLSGSGPPHLELPALTEIDGTLSFAATSTIGAVVLPRLATVRGAVFLHRLDALVRLDLPGLEQAGAFVAAQLEGLGELDVPMLRTVEGAMVVRTTTAVSVSAASLTRVEGPLVVDSNVNLETLSVPALESVGGLMMIAANDRLGGIEFPQLTTVGGALVVGANAALSTLDLPSLSSSGRTLDFRTNDVGPSRYDVGSLVRSHFIARAERRYDVRDNQFRVLGTINDLEDRDVSDLLDPDCRLGTTELYLEVFISDSTYVPTRFEYTKDNNSRGFAMNLPAPPGGWQVGWNTVVTNATAGGYECSGACTDICDTPWDDMNRLELYRSGPATGTTPAQVAYRNIRLSRYDPLDASVGAASVAISGNPSLPQCVVDAATQPVAAAGPVVSSGNRDNCTCDPGMVICN